MRLKISTFLILILTFFSNTSFTEEQKSIYNYSPCWLANGKIVYIEKKSKQDLAPAYRLCVINSDGSDDKVIKEFSDIKDILSISTGSKSKLVCLNTGNDIYTINFDGTNFKKTLALNNIPTHTYGSPPRKAKTIYRKIIDLKLSPDGTKILFTLTENYRNPDKNNPELFGQNSVWVINLEDNSSYLVAKNAKSALWTEDSKKILYYRGRQKRGFYIKPIFEQRLEKFTLKIPEEPAELSPEGKEILNEAKIKNIVSQKGKLEHSRWSADREKIIGQLLVDGQSRICIIDKDGTGLKIIK